LNTHIDKKTDNTNLSISNAVSLKKKGGDSRFQLVDKRPEAIAQRKLQEIANNSPQIKKFMQLQAKVDNQSNHLKQPIQKKENDTGLPDNLKTSIESLSGYSMDDVKVHYNSDKPAQLQAHAYTQGTDIHLSPGQTKHLPHEAWHIVQQKQGRVKPTLQMKDNVEINHDVRLEEEANVMGNKAMQMKSFGDQVLSSQLPLGYITSSSVQMISTVELKEEIEKALEEHPTEEEQRAALKEIFSDAGVDERIKIPYLARHTNNTQLVPLPPHPVQKTMPIDEIVPRCEELTESTDELIQEYLSLESDEFTSEIDAYYYGRFKIAEADFHYTIYQAMSSISSLPETVDKTEPLSATRELLSRYKDTFEIALSTIGSSIKENPELLNKFKEELSESSKWLLSAGIELKRDSFFKKEHIDVIADFATRTDQDKEDAEQALTKSHPMLSASSMPHDHKEMFLDSLVEMVIQGKEIGIELASLTARTELDLITRPMADSEFMTPLANEGVVSPTVLWCPYSNFFSYTVDDDELKLNAFPSWVGLLHELGHYKQSLDDGKEYAELLNQGNTAEIERDNLVRHEGHATMEAGLGSRKNYEDHIFQSDRMDETISDYEAIDLGVLSRVTASRLSDHEKQGYWTKHYKPLAKSKYDKLFQSAFIGGTNLFEEAEATGEDLKDTLYEYFGNVQSLQFSSKPPTLEKLKETISLGEASRKIASDHGYLTKEISNTLTLLLTLTTLSLE